MISQRTTLVAVVVAVFGIAVVSVLSAQVRNVPFTKSDNPSRDSDPTRVVMQAKLIHSQKVMEGLVTQDFDMIEAAAGALSEISLTPPPDLAKTGDKTDEQVYEHFRMEFARLAGQLKGHARREELEATAWVQQNMTATCIACHEYIRDFNK